ncbi:TetR family transcriptional regulator [Actinocrinis puniceicyclus]|uniref:TetR family transcriptional regulator n=1 Tax=Actinocrinis puniceicyclus TaxID=977794 RepID=A0A8J8BDJ5_9ACTN|nr:TetR/AcrR family transcriptional regulator [Actinocrinis puniceicyclus]MBS2966307.1 TetR family transcriptional regulator [Actinocrinis puniceicyclus]
MQQAEGVSAAGRAEGGGAGSLGGQGGAGSARMRREPRQQRSRARVRQILAAADEILSAEGFEALTVRRIAQVAGVPVGSIYQFFPDKAAVVDALAGAYIGQFDAAIGRLVAASAVQRWADPVGTLVEAFAGLYRANPGYVALWSGRHLSPELARADEANNAAIAQGVRLILVRQAGLADGARLELSSRVAVAVADALLQFAFRLAPRGDEEVLEELKELLRLYLERLSARLAGP